MIRCMKHPYIYNYILSVVTFHSVHKCPRDPRAVLEVDMLFIIRDVSMSERAQSKGWHVGSKRQKLSFSLRAATSRTFLHHHSRAHMLRCLVIYAHQGLRLYLSSDVSRLKQAWGKAQPVINHGLVLTRNDNQNDTASMQQSCLQAPDLMHEQPKPNHHEASCTKPLLQPVRDTVYAVTEAHLPKNRALLVIECLCQVIILVG